MKLIDQLTDYVNAAFAGLWVQTHEPDEAEREITQHALSDIWRLACWDVAGGLRVLQVQRGEDRDKKITWASGAANGSSDAGAGDPLAALRALPALAQPHGTALLLLHNFHRFLSSPDVVQTLFKSLIAGKKDRTFVVVLSPIVQIPVELEKLFVVIEHALPDHDQLERIARELTSDSPNDLPNGDNLKRVLEAASGLTRYEAEGAFALSLTRHNAIEPQSIWELKAQTLKKNNLLTLYRGAERFDSLGGLTNLKEFCRRTLRPGKRVRAKGVLLLSPPGCGKSAFAKALGNETGRPTLMLDIGTLMGSLVGATEANIRQALRIADACSPCCLFIDELEKALSGVGSQGDSGVSTRLFGTLLSYLADHESDVFFVATSNDISKLPPEFTRAERFDGVFFIDVPISKDRDAIWELYRKQFSIPESQARPDDSDWTGAEIKSCCRLAALLDATLTQAANNVVPVAVTAAEQVERLRAWASGRCLDASGPGIYRREGVAALKPARRIQRPTNN